MLTRQKSTTVFPFIVLHPASGFGLFGLKGTPVLRRFMSSVMNHLFFGFRPCLIATLLPLGEH